MESKAQSIPWHIMTVICVEVKLNISFQSIGYQTHIEVEDKWGPPAFYQKLMAT